MQFLNIPKSEEWESLVALNKGWSSDKKYIVTWQGKKYLLRVSLGDVWETKNLEYEILQKYARTGLAMSQPIDFGLCERGVYMLLSWVEGEDLQDVLPRLREAEQCRLGRRAGEILKQIHSIPLEKKHVPAQTKIPRKLRQLQAYRESGLHMPEQEKVLAFVEQNIDCIWKNPPVYQHGDFHPGNMIYTGEDIALIDFNRWEVSDAYEEFYKLESFGLDCSVAYCRGQIDGYFADNVPEVFWKALAVYVAHGALHSMVWAIPYGEAELAGMQRRYLRALKSYEGFTRLVPRWYGA